MSAPPKPKGRPPTTQQPTSNAPKDAIPDHIQYILGVAVLSLALVISAFMGLFQEKTYSMYGRGGSVWQESIFYSVSFNLQDKARVDKLIMTKT
jgi:UDP-xylose/UDP-N-acetylglucosamine transporter B4